MRPVTVARTSAGVTAPVVIDQYVNPCNISLAVKIAGGAATGTYTVEHTFDDVFSSTFDPATAVWYPHPTLAALSANGDGAYQAPPAACRLNCSAVGAGATVTLTVRQAGIT